MTDPTLIRQHFHEMMQRPDAEIDLARTALLVAAENDPSLDVDSEMARLETWARELGRKGIRANAICPGFIETPILSSIPDKVIKMMEDKVPMGRLGKPEEIANTYAWLASDEASYINGAVIEVSGGCTI